MNGKQFSGNRSSGSQNYRRDDYSKAPTPKVIDVSVLETGVKDVSLMREWGHFLAEGKDSVKTSQLRKFFGAVKKIQADFDNSKGEIVLLSPKLAYAVGRNQKSKIKDLYRVLSPLIEKIGEDKKKFKNFINVFEAIVAYHKEIVRE
jgi:CRISPR-associated protein Csm2